MFLASTNLEFISNNLIYEYIYIFLISFFSNVISAISGGGAGLVQLPALILFGIPFYQALATHKIATVALGIGGSIRNYKLLSKDFKVISQILIFGIPGVIFGTSIVRFLSEKYLYLILGLFTILLAIYSFYKPNLGIVSRKKEISFISRIRFIVLVFLIGILNGSISSGTGLLITILLIKTYGMDFIRSISITLFTVGIFWNACGAFILSRIGTIPLNILLILIIGSFTGGFVGAHLSNFKGNVLVKKSFTLVCFLVGISLLLKTINNFFKFI